jgi:pre-mRNA-splicing factor ATP-dependent RNA helicase DHX16
MSSCNAYTSSRHPTASKAKSAEALFSQLVSSGLPDTPDAHSFTSEVFTNAPRKRKGKNQDRNSNAARKAAEQEAKALRGQKFGLMLEGEDASLNATAPVRKDKGKEKSERRIRKRDTDTRDWEDDEEDRAIRKRRRDEREAEFEQRHGRRDDSRREEDGMDEEEEYEDEETRKDRQYAQDRKEREEFSERMKQKDKDKTKKMVEDRSSKTFGAQEAAERRRLADDTAARVAAMPSLRERSRQAYLSKRELQQIELLRREIVDDEALFHGMKVSRREQQELDYKKEVLQLAEERMKIDGHYDGYQLPDDYFTEQGKIDKKKKEAVLYQRYDDAAKDKPENFVTDVDHWEQAQTRNSAFKTGAMDKQELVEEFDYVFDESQTIKFIVEQTLSGEGMNAKDAALHKMLHEAEERGTESFICLAALD